MGDSISTRRSTGYGSAVKGPLWQALSDGTFQQITNADGDLVAPVDTPDLMFSDGEAIEDNNGNEIIKVSVASSAVNEVTVANAATGNTPSLSATGGDTNISLIVKGKGTGAVRLGQATSTDVRLEADQPIADSSGNEFIAFSKTASAVNHISTMNAATGNYPRIGAAGDDANINLGIGAKGTGIVRLDGGTTPNAASATAGAATSNSQVSVITSESLTTAADATYTLTLTNNKISATAGVLVSLSWGTNSQGRPVVEKITPGSGSVTIIVRNYAAATALNGTLIFHVLVL